MSDLNQSTIHTAVREHYGAIAVSAGSCCGDTSCGCTADNLYNTQLLEGLPFDVTGLSLGCGDPVTIANLQPGETVLDLGSGGGIDCFMAARQVGDRGYVIGVDMTPAMIEKANTNKARLGLNNVEFRLGQIEALPVEDDSIDIIMSNCVINLSPDKAAVFNEMLRVLKPGGRISISDIVTDGPFSAEMRADSTKWSECVSGAIEAQEYIDLIRDAGFADVEIVDKADAGDAAPQQGGTPRIFSARITARKLEPPGGNTV